jgi:hypothetical protein
VKSPNYAPLFLEHSELRTNELTNQQTQFCTETAHNTTAVTVVVDESAIKVGKTEKTLDVMDVSGGWPGDNGRYLFGIHPDPIFGDEVSQEWDLRDVEQAFFWLDV